MSTPCLQEDRIENIEISVKEINKDISCISSDIAVIKDRMGTVLDKVEDHEHLLRGTNGYSGVVASIENSNKLIDKFDKAMFSDGGFADSVKAINSYIKKREEDDKSKTAERKDNFKWLWRLVVGSAVTAILGWIYVLINLK